MRGSIPPRPPSPGVVRSSCRSLSRKPPCTPLAATEGPPFSLSLLPPPGAPRPPAIGAVWPAPSRSSFPAQRHEPCFSRLRHACGAPSALGPPVDLILRHKPNKRDHEPPRALARRGHLGEVEDPGVVPAISSAVAHGGDQHRHAPDGGGRGPTGTRAPAACRGGSMTGVATNPSDFRPTSGPRSRPARARRRSSAVAALARASRT